MATLLTHDELSQALGELDAWTLHRGALRTRIQAPNFMAAVTLLAQIAELAEAMDHHPDIDLRWRKLDVALSTHSAGGITEMDVGQARAIGELAARADAELVQPASPGDGIEIAIDCMDPAAIRDFWRVGLGLSDKATPDGAVDLVGADERSPGVWFQQMTESRPQRNRIHIDVYVPRDRAQERVAAVVRAGGRLLTDEHAPSWWVLADAEGNELCVCT